MPSPEMFDKDFDEMVFSTPLIINRAADIIVRGTGLTLGLIATYKIGHNFDFIDSVTAVAGGVVYCCGVDQT